jgi:3-hydroxybutyryl-CoA dehydrogenase
MAVAPVAEAAPAERVLCVFGAGTMGGQIAHQAALHGCDVRLLSRRPERLEAAMRDGAKVLRRRVEKGKLSDAELSAAIARITPLTEPAAALTGADVVIESVAEDRNAKREVLQRICEHVRDEVIIGTNSSTLPSSLLAPDVVRPERFLNVHFFNPPLQMPLVEVVRGPHTSESTVNAAMDFAESIGKTPVLVRKEAYGFIVNRILFIAMQEAFRLVEDGVVSIEDCDLAVRNGLGWPMGMFELADLVGLDVVESILAEGLAQTGEARWAPPALLHEHVARGELGRKSGHGFTP